MTNDDHPITRLTIKMERAERDVIRLDAWTRDPQNADSEDWEYQYRALRRAECAARRRKVAIMRIDAALYGATEIHAATIKAVRGPLAWCNRPTWRR